MDWKSEDLGCIFTPEYVLHQLPIPLARAWVNQFSKTLDKKDVHAP